MTAKLTKLDPMTLLRSRGACLLPVLGALLGACGDDGGSGLYEGDEPALESVGEGSAEAGDEPGDSGPAAACDDQTPVSLFLSPDDSNSTSSPVQVRTAVRDFDSLAEAPIRTWEFLNYYSFDYQRGEPGTLTVTPEIAQIDGAPAGQYVLQIGVTSEALTNADRPLMNLTLVLDESGSMDGAAIVMERAVCRRIASNLRAGDIVSMVGWDTDNAVKLANHPVTGPDDPSITSACDGLAPGGGTDLNGGLRAGYDLAHAQYDDERLNRVVLISDGGANAGVTDIDLIAGGAGGQDQEGIYLVGVGVGDSYAYNDSLMDTVTDAGRGASLFIPDQAEVDRMFGERFVQTMAVAARDVRVRLDLPPGFEIVAFSGEEYSANPEEIEPQHLAPNDAMVFHQTVATCAPQRIDDTTTFTVAVQWQDAVTFAARSVEVTRPIAQMLADPSPMLQKGAAVYAYAESLKAYRDSPTAAALDPAFAALDRADKLLPGDPDLHEIREVLTTLRD